MLASTEMGKLPLSSQCSWTRAVLLLWATLWLLAVPLFHSHAEANHDHGDLHHIHATVHSIFSSDFLPFSAPARPPKHAGLSDHADSMDDPEIGFSVATSKGRDTGKPLSHAVCGEVSSVTAFCLCASQSFFITKPPGIVLASGVSSRAPPFPAV